MRPGRTTLVVIAAMCAILAVAPQTAIAGKKKKAYEGAVATQGVGGQTPTIQLKVQFRRKAGKLVPDYVANLKHRAIALFCPDGTTTFVGPFNAESGAVMERLRGRKPSPAMVVSIIALVFALAGSAAAGVATVSVLSKKEKKQTRNIANSEIDKRAPGLSVASAQSAANATSATNATNAQSAGALADGGLKQSAFKLSVVVTLDFPSIRLRAATRWTATSGRGWVYWQALRGRMRSSRLRISSRCHKSHSSRAI